MLQSSDSSDKAHGFITQARPQQSARSLNLSLFRLPDPVSPYRAGNMCLKPQNVLALSRRGPVTVHDEAPSASPAVLPSELHARADARTVDRDN